MADLESYCDSEEEVFFGPVTEKERKIAENLRRRAMIPRNLRSHEPTSSSQEGEEGLHTLAMAAQLLSLSSCGSGESPQEVKDYQSIECGKAECCNDHSARDTSAAHLEMNSNEGNHLELDAVKFLSLRLPEQNQSAYFADSSAESGSNLCGSSNIHHTSLVSCMDNDVDFFKDLNNDSCMDANLVHNNCKSDTEKKNGDSLDVIGNDSNLEVIVSSGMTEVASEELDEKYDLLDVKDDCMDWENTNEISKGDFAMKLSDNEEEMEKAERNLKVEEIIKFLADEDEKSEVKLLGEIEEKQSLIHIPVNDPHDSKILMFMSFENVDACVSSDDHPLCEHYQTGELAEKNSVNESSALNVSNGAEEVPEWKILPKEIKNEEKLQETAEGVAVDCTLKGLVKKEVEEALRVDHSVVDKKPPVCQTSGHACQISTPSNSGKKAPQTVSMLKKTLSNVKPVPNPKVTIGMEKRQATPRPIRMPNTRMEGVKNQSTPRPLRPLQLPATSTVPSRNCARPLLQENGQTPTKDKTFKTPNSMVKPTVGSKIPHLCPYSPSPNKNKKFAGIVSPVSQYIHNKPVLLISNKKPSAEPPTPPRVKEVMPDIRPKLPSSETVMPKLQSLPNVIGDRGAENVDANNYATLPEVNYKSALPVKIWSPCPSSKTPKSGKTAVVTKHLGHIKITSAESGKGISPLALQFRESMMPDGEVSLLLSKEVELHCPATLRN